MQELRTRFREEAMRVIKTLCIPRLVGTAGDAQVAQSIIRILRDADIPHGIEEFSGGTLHMRVLNRLFFPLIGCEMIGLFLLNLFGVWIGAFILAIVGGVISLRIHLLIPWVLAKTVNAGRKLNSKNFIFRAPQKSGTSAPEIKQDLYFLAHWDSKSERLPVWYLFPVTIIGEFLNLFFCLHYLLVIFIGGFLPPSDPGVFLWGPICGFFTLPQLFNAMGNKSPGALDDASGVAICVGLQTYFQQFPTPPSVQVTFVLTGMEEFGDKGGRKFLELHRNEFSKDQSHFIVLDTIGDGNTVFHNKHGLFPVKDFDADMATVIEAVIRTAPDRFCHIKHLYLPPSPVVTDHVPFHQAGFHTLIIESSTFKTHSVRDAMDAIDPAQLAECMDLLVCVINYLGGKKIV